jgi:hypothetical protein
MGGFPGGKAIGGRSGHDSNDIVDHPAMRDGCRPRDPAGIRRRARTGPWSPPAALWKHLVLVLRQPRRPSRLSNKWLLSRKLLRRSSNLMARHRGCARRKFRAVVVSLSLPSCARAGTGSTGLRPAALLRRRERHLSRARRAPPSVLRRVISWSGRSGDGPIPRGLRLSTRSGRSKIRLSSIELSEGKIAIGALRSGKYRVAINLRTSGAGQIHEHHCHEPCCPMSHAVLRRVTPGSNLCSRTC